MLKYQWQFSFEVRCEHAHYMCHVSIKIMLCCCQSNVSSSQWHQPHQLQRPQIHSQSLPPCRLHQKTALFVLCFQSNRKYQNHLKSWPVQISYTKETTILFVHLEKTNFVICKRVLIISILDFPLWLTIISFIFLYLSKPLFSSFLQFKENFVRGLSNAVSELF